jgi:coenzyme F420 hydrogenase subunit beta
VRKIQQKLPQDCKLTVIGLFCFEAFNRAKLKQEIQSRLDVDIDEAKKTQVRQGKFIVSVGDRKLDCKVKDLDSAAEPSCNFCDDFTSQLADISVGSVGSKEGFSTVIVRSETGAAAAARLEAQKGTVNKSEVIRIAKLKRERAKKAFTNHEKPS